MKTIKIPDGLHLQLKTVAVQSGIELQTLVEIWLTQALDTRGRLIYARAGKDWREYRTVTVQSENEQDDI